MTVFHETTARLVNDLVRDFDLTPDQAVGIAASLAFETGEFKFMQELRPVIEGTRGGYGFAQWTAGRRNNFEEYTRSQRLDPASYEANYGFLKEEIASNRDYTNRFNRVRNATTPAEATTIFTKEYLAPSIPKMSERIALARKVTNEVLPDVALQSALRSYKATDPTLASYLAARGTPLPRERPDRAPTPPPMPRPRPETVRGPGASMTQDRMVNRSVDLAKASTDNSLKAALQAKLAPPMPSRLATDTRLLREANQANTNAERNRAVVASIPTRSAPARLPELPPSRLGAAPATRAVQSVAMPATAQTPTQRAAALYAGGGPTRPVALTPTQKAAQLYAQGGPTRPGSNVSERLAAGEPGLPERYGNDGVTPGRVAMIGTGISGQVNPQGQRVPAQQPTIQVASGAPVPVPRNARPIPGASAPVQVAAAPVPMPQSARPTARAPAPVRVAVAPVPMPSSARPTAVGTQLAVTPPKIAPVPMPRPAFGMGGGEPNLATRVSDHLMNNTLPGRAITGAGIGIGNLQRGLPLLGSTAQQSANLRGVGDAFMDTTPIGRLLGMLTGRTPNPIAQAVQPRALPMPGAGGGQTAMVQALRDRTGMSSAQAYEALNARARSGDSQSWATQDRTRDRDGGASSLTG